MSGFEIAQEYREAMQELKRLIDQQESDGRGMNSCELQYDRALALAMLRLRDEGVPWGQCERVAKGERDVSLAKCAWHSAEVVYTAAKERVQAQKRDVDFLKEEHRRIMMQARYFEEG